MGRDTAFEKQSLKNSRAAYNKKDFPMRLISREELKEKLDKREDIKLVFALNEWQYRSKHIPGSLNFYKLEEALKVLDQDDKIVVYCSNEACPASVFAYHFLVNHGFKNVRRYAGGLLDWEDAGYPLEGEGLK
jgi:rhodanese-related sulfurtransferase